MSALALIALPLLVVAYDVSRCLAFHREANQGAPRPRAPRPRSLAPDQVTLRHALLFLLQKANYYWQILTSIPLLARMYLAPRRTTDLDVASLILNCSLATWTTSKPLAGGGVAVTLRVEGFAFPLVPDRFDGRLLVDFELRPSDPEPEARTLRFELDGVAIDARDEQLSILAIMISSVAHPVIHSFNNRLYESHDDPRLQALDDLFLHGQYLNWSAWFWPGLLFRIRRARGHHWYRRVLGFNAELKLPAHGPASMAPLAPYSRSIRFLLAARPALAGLCRRYALPVDVEALFLCTILHAVDHVSCDIHTRGRLMKHERLPNEGFFNLIALVFYRPAQHFWTNLLKDKRRKHPLYEELYTALHDIDAELADQVTLSISY